MQPSRPQPPPWTAVPHDEAARLNGTPTMRALGYVGGWVERVEVKSSGRRVSVCQPTPAAEGDHG